MKKQLRVLVFQAPQMDFKMNNRAFLNPLSTISPWRLENPTGWFWMCVEGGGGGLQPDWEIFGKIRPPPELAEWLPLKQETLWSHSKHWEQEGDERCAKTNQKGRTLIPPCNQWSKKDEIRLLHFDLQQGHEQELLVATFSRKTKIKQVNLLENYLCFHQEFINMFLNKKHIHVALL